MILPTDDGEERVWAVPLDGGRYRIDNVPFFAYNVSVGDVVEAPGPDRVPLAHRVVRRSGHRTIRVAFEEPEGLEGEAARAFVAELERLGCGYEGFEPMLLAVDVPPEVESEAVERLCEEGGLTWEYGDPQPDRPVLGESDAG